MYLSNVNNSITNLKKKYNVLSISQSPFSNSCYIECVKKNTIVDEFSLIWRIRISDHRNIGGLAYNHIYSIYSENGTFCLNNLKMREIELNIEKYKQVGVGCTSWIKYHYLIFKRNKYNKIIQTSNHLTKFV